MQTTHNTTLRQMTHDFPNGYKIVVDFNFNIAKIQFGNKYESFSIEGMSIEEYMNIVSKYGKY